MKVKNIKNTIQIFVFIAANIVFAQTERNLELVTIINNKIVTEKQVNEYWEKGYIKGIQNGVSDKKI